MFRNRRWLTVFRVCSYSSDRCFMSAILCFLFRQFRFCQTFRGGRKGNGVRNPFRDEGKMRKENTVS